MEENCLGDQEARVGFPEEMRSLDLSVALARVGDDEELLKEIAQIFLDEGPAALAEVRAAADAGDAHAVERAAHTLKGSVGNFGAETARQSALRIEEMGRNGDLSGVQQALADLDEALCALSSELSRFAAG